MINYYVDPGSGFIFTQNPSFLWALILGFFGGFFVFFKFFFFFLKRFFWWIFVLLLVILIAWGVMMPKPSGLQKVIVIGVDGMDTAITERLMREGKLPNFSRVMREGAYGHLATTVSSETPVVWSSIATGLNPGGHGIFDFVMRNPKDYSLYLSLDEISNAGGKTKIHRYRKGDCLWDILSRNRIPSFIYFYPNTFPPVPVEGRMLSGMGVPDITGMTGKYTLYTTRPLTEQARENRGRRINIQIIKGVASSYLYGPRVATGGSEEESRVPLTIAIDSDKESAAVTIGGKQISLQQGQWSQWQKVSFRVGSFKSVHGITRFYLRSVKPDVQLYATPVNFDPENPPFFVSYPHGYSKKLAEEIGPYYTQGMPYDTWALAEDALDEKGFLEQVDEVFAEHKKILKKELREFKRGLFFFYVETLDAVQHMFWRYADTRHPLYEQSPSYQETVFAYYRKIDDMIGDVLKLTDKETVLIVLSDHGFSDFRRAVDINRWLIDNGFLFIKGEKNEGKEFFEDVDWLRTKAYALGFGGIYLNKKGREGSGIVGGAEAEGLKKEIIAGLKALRDPVTSGAAIKEVYDANEIYRGPYTENAPDLFVGFNSGYRASWQTALGGASSRLIEDNKKKWSGDHLVDPGLVPGVLFVNRKILLPRPSVLDIAPSILRVFNITAREMEGKVLFE